MTDKEIIRALKCCTSEVTLELNCSTCSMFGVKDCMTETKKNALDLINRQQAEIERLMDEKENLRCVIEDLSNNTEYAKTEAIKEFAERLKNLIYPQLSISTYEKGEAFHFCLDEINNLVKEMKESEE